MGFFSWNTQDTNRSIRNRHSGLPTFTVYMFDNKGNKWVEDNYDGYGIFGGKDYYELLAEMNGFTTRDEGIKLQFDSEKLGLKRVNVLFPNLAQNPNWKWDENTYPLTCEAQGFFYSWI